MLAKPDPPIRAIVFDFGNVVAFFDHRRAARQLARYGALPAETVYQHLFGGPLEDDYESGRLTTAEYIGQVRRLCGLRCTDEELGAAFADIFWPNEEVIRLLPYIKPHYRLLLGSNTNELHAVHFLKQFAEPLRLFDGLVLSHEVGLRKPGRGFFEHCQRLAGCADRECLFIDDLLANVEGARACGWHGLVYESTEALVRRLAELGIEGLPPLG